MAKNRDYLDEKFKELNETLTKLRVDVDVVTHDVAKLQKATSTLTKRKVQIQRKNNKW